MSELERLWAAYVQASRRAQETHVIDDGIAAGRAWRAWLEAFASERRTPPSSGLGDGKVVALRRRP